MLKPRTVVSGHLSAAREPTCRGAVGWEIVSIIGGLIVFGDPLGHRPAIVLIHLAAFGVIVFAAWLLAPAQAAVAAPAT